LLAITKAWRWHFATYRARNRNLRSIFPCLRDSLNEQVRLGLLVAKAGVARPVDEVERETAQLVHDRVGPVASLRTALVVVAGVPKTRSGKILCCTMRKIAAGENYSLLATIDDPAIVAAIDRALATAGYAER
jgi:propionyl-CoA synthetase